MAGLCLFALQCQGERELWREEERQAGGGARDLRERRPEAEAPERSLHINGKVP